MRLMSFAMTTAQVLDGTKHVTRRRGWWKLQPGSEIQAVEKSMGLKKGERVKVLRQLRVYDVRIEPLERMVLEPDYGRLECRLEGFPDLSPQAFVEMFCASHGCVPADPVMRIAFAYVDGHGDGC